MSSDYYSTAIVDAVKGPGIFVTGNTYNAMVLRTSYVFSYTHAFVSDVVAHELTATPYARQVVTVTVGSWDAGNVRVPIDLTNMSFGSAAAGNEFNSVVIFDNAGGSDAARKLRCRLVIPTRDTDATPIIVNGQNPAFWFTPLPLVL